MVRPFAVFDIDGTLIRWQLYHAIADTIAKLGYVDPAIFESVRDARRLWKQRTHEDSFRRYERKLVQAYEQVLTNLSVEHFDEAAQIVFEQYKDQVYTYTRDLIRALKKKNYLLFAISGSQAEIVGHMAKYYGFDDYIGTKYVRRSNRFTGQVILFRSTKDTVLKKMVNKHKATFRGSVGVGDSESDIAMLEAVEQPIAFNPTKKLFAHAKAKGWKIVVERKNMIYELEDNNGSYLLAKTNR